MIIYNTTNEPVFINFGVIADPLGGPGRGEVICCLHPNCEGAIDLKAYGLMTKEEIKEHDAQV